MDDFPRFDLTGQIALVTGAARGLGRSYLALAHAGADVALGLRDASRDGGLVQEIETLGRRALPLQMDMTRTGQIAHAVSDAVARFGRLDILVNNAGIAPDNLAEKVREEDFDLTVAINLKGTFFASQAAARVMIAQKSGSYRQHEFAGGFRRTSHRIGLLHDESRHCSPDEMSRCGMGLPQYPRQRRGAYVYPHAWHGDGAIRSRVPGRRDRTHRSPPSHR